MPALHASLARWQTTCLIFLGMCALACSMQTSAANLGELTILSGMGQPLRAEIQIYDLSNEETNALEVKLASEAAFIEAESERTEFMRKLKIRVVKEGNKHFVFVDSSKPLTEPLVGLLLEMQVNGVSKFREYAVVPDDFQTTLRLAEHPEELEAIRVAESAPQKSNEAELQLAEPQTASADNSAVTNAAVESAAVNNEAPAPKLAAIAERTLQEAKNLPELPTENTQAQDSQRTVHRKVIYDNQSAKAEFAPKDKLSLSPAQAAGLKNKKIAKVSKPTEEDLLVQRHVEEELDMREQLLQKNIEEQKKLLDMRAELNNKLANPEPVAQEADNTMRTSELALGKNTNNAATSKLNFSLGSNLGNLTKKISPYITPESILLTGLVMLLGWIFLLQRRRKIRLIESVIRDLDKVA